MTFSSRIGMGNELPILQGYRERYKAWVEGSK